LCVDGRTDRAKLRALGRVERARGGYIDAFTHINAQEGLSAVSNGIARPWRREVTAGRYRGFAFAGCVLLGAFGARGMSHEWLPWAFLLGVLGALSLGAMAVVRERTRPANVARPTLLWWWFLLVSACFIGLGIGMLWLASA
jgi:hypothetical protein